MIQNDYPLDRKQQFNGSKPIMMQLYRLLEMFDSDFHIKNKWILDKQANYLRMQNITIGDYKNIKELLKNGDYQTLDILLYNLGFVEQSKITDYSQAPF